MEKSFIHQSENERENKELHLEALFSTEIVFPFKFYPSCGRNKREDDDEGGEEEENILNDKKNWKKKKSPNF